MKLPTAIEILTIHNDHNPNFTDLDRRQAHQLGIEALQLITILRVADNYPDPGTLPSEDPPDSDPDTITPKSPAFSKMWIRK